jgi:lipoate-protein ligase B
LQANPARRCTVSRPGLVEYKEACGLQQSYAKACHERSEQHLLLLEHPPTYTLGARGNASNLLVSDSALTKLGATVCPTDRGGDVTFHGPGQLVGYPILDLSLWNRGPVWYVRSLEAMLLETLAAFGIDSCRQPGRPGVWIGNAKIGAIGVRVSRGITRHGFALNVAPDLSFFSHIVPCGLQDIEVTSIAQVLGDEAPSPAMDQVMDAAVQAFANVFDLEMHDCDRVVSPRSRVLTMAQ